MAEDSVSSGDLKGCTESFAEQVPIVLSEVIATLEAEMLSHLLHCSAADERPLI